MLPGIMPITNGGQVRRMAELSGAALPAWLVERLDGVDDPAEVRRIGVDLACELCAELLEAGAPGLHFYTLNRSTASREIYANLGLGATVAGERLAGDRVGHEAARVETRPGRRSVAVPVPAGARRHAGPRRGSR